MSFPGSLDDLPLVNPGEMIASSLENQRITAINAIEVALGINPFGSYPTVAAAIAAMASVGGIQAASYTYADDTGTSDACAIALNPVVTAYVEGLTAAFKVAVTNTSASTLSINGLAAKAIVKYGSQALVAGDLVAGSICVVIYDGTNFQLLVPAIVPVTEGGTGAPTASAARSNLGAAASGPNNDITSLSGLTTPLFSAQGGTGVASPTAHGIMVGEGTGSMAQVLPVQAGYVLTDNGPGHDPTYQPATNAGGAMQLQALSDL